MAFVKAAKCLSLSNSLYPLGGCAIAVGILFGAFLRASAYSPEHEDVFFGHTMLGFALIETFMVIVVLTMGLIYSL